MEKGYIDFHLHSTNSDGERTVEEYILDAAREHMQAIAITDHNCFALRERKISRGVEVIPARGYPPFPVFPTLFPEFFLYSRLAHGHICSKGFWFSA